MRVAALVFRDDRRHDGVAAGKGDADPQDALLILVRSANSCCIARYFSGSLRRTAKRSLRHR